MRLKDTQIRTLVLGRTCSETELGLGMSALMHNTCEKVFLKGVLSSEVEETRRTELPPYKK